MMNPLTHATQRLARTLSRKGGDRLKLLSVLGMHLLRRRYIGVFIDPILACNLRCQMCYFSDPEYRATLRGKLTTDDCEAIAPHLFPYALRLQIGCGAEPTLTPETMLRLVQLGKEYHVPWISVITNGNALTEDTLRALVTAGLSELTLSLHGTTQATYERLMVGAEWQRFVTLLEWLKMLDNPPAVRLNYTVNRDNLEELSRLPDLIRNYPVGTVQIRPVQKIGESAYKEFDMAPLVAAYDRVIATTVERLRADGIEVICPSSKKMSQTTKPPRRLAKLFEEATYYYISPQSFGPQGVDFRAVSLRSYARQSRLVGRLLRAIFTQRNTYAERDTHTTKKLNY